MGRKKGINILKIAVMITFGVGLLSGCGKEKEIDYSIEGATETVQTESDGGKTAVAQFANETSWDESWTYEEGQEELKVSVQVNVNADIQLPDLEEMSVIEVTVPEFDADFKEHVVKTLFENADVFYNDAEHLPKKELEKVYDDYKWRYEIAATEADRAEIKSNLAYYETLLENAGDTYTIADAFEGKDYIGEKNGITYELWFTNSYGGKENWDMNAQYFVFNAINFEEYCPKEYTDYTMYMAHPYMTCDRYTSVGENECELSLEDAEKQTRELLEGLGLEYPILAEVRPLMWGDDTMSSANIYDWPANGYVFRYEYGVDDISFVGFGAYYDYYEVTGTAYYTVGEPIPYSTASFAEIYVTDKGIIHLNVNSPVETASISESVELLPLDTIKEILKEELIDTYKMYSGSYEVVDTYTHLELIYFRVGDEENRRTYSYIPAWRISEQIGDSVLKNWEIRRPGVVNAIDGSWINVRNEIGGQYSY